MPLPENQPSSARRTFRLRIVSGLGLGAAAVAVALAGGPGFAAFWALAAITVALEWVAMFAVRRRALARVTAATAIVAAVIALEAGWLGAGLLAVAAGVLVLALISGPMAGLGVAYAAPVALGAIVLRADPQLGLAAIVWLFAVVWGTDIAAYFVGRAVGGPRLWRAVSPGKTWSGAVGGALFGTAASMAVAALFGLRGFVALGLVGLLVSLTTQAGDLFESSLKRRAGVKDSGHIIPGHGGVMDRLDGFTAAACLAASIGILRAGAQSAGQGLLSW